jgi:hypothetical protein
MSRLKYEDKLDDISLLSQLVNNFCNQNGTKFLHFAVVLSTAAHKLYLLICYLRGYLAFLFAETK